MGPDTRASCFTEIASSSLLTSNFLINFSLGRHTILFPFASIGAILLNLGKTRSSTVAIFCRFQLATLLIASITSLLKTRSVGRVFRLFSLKSSLFTLPFRLFNSLTLDTTPATLFFAYGARHYLAYSIWGVAEI